LEKAAESKQQRDRRSWFQNRVPVIGVRRGLFKEMSCERAENLAAGDLADRYP